MWAWIGAAMLLACAWLSLVILAVSSIHIGRRWWLMLNAGMDWDDAGTLMRMNARRIHGVHRVTDKSDFRLVRASGPAPAHADGPGETMLIDLPVVEPPLEGGLDLSGLELASRERLASPADAEAPTMNIRRLN